MSALLSVSCANFAQTDRQPVLKVGDKAPALDALKWVKGAPISEFKKGRMYLVDFGATWCVPCAKAIPHLTDIAASYRQDLDVIGVFVMESKKSPTDLSYVGRVEQYVQQKGAIMNYNVAVDKPEGSIENQWLKAAHLNGIPQTFIIDRDGLIAWIGAPNETNLRKVLDQVKQDAYSITDAIEGSKLQKAFQRPTLDQSKVLFASDNGGESDFLYRSVLTSYKGEKALGSYDYVHSMPWIRTPSGKLVAGVQQVGVSLSNLYFMAYEDTLSRLVYTRQPYLNMEYPDPATKPHTRSFYGKYWYKPLLEVADPSAFRITPTGNENKYSYSLLTTDARMTAAKLQQIMRNDLKGYFGYEVVVEERKMPCWKLVATAPAESLLKARQPDAKFNAVAVNDTLFKNTSAVMKDIWVRLVLSFSYANQSFDEKPLQEAPFIDATGITGKIDYDISVAEMKAFQESNWEGVLQFLHRWGLDLKKGEQLMKVIVIKDPPSNR